MSMANQHFTRRRFLQYAGATTLGGSLLAACGSTTGPGSLGGNGSSISLQQWYHQYGETGTEAAAKRYAKEYTKASVTVRWTPGDYGTVLNSALLSNNPPDVFEMGGIGVDQVKRGLFEPLDDLLAPVKDDFNPVSLAPFTVDGKVYGIKMIDDTGLLYYRKSLLQKAGLQPPQTFGEVIAAAKKLTTGDVKGLFVGNDGGIGALTNIAPWSAGSDFLTDNKIVFNNDRTAAAIEKIVELNKTNALLLGNPTDWWDTSAFTQGLAAMQWTGLWAMPAIIKALGDDFGVVPWPKLDAQGTPATFLGGWATFVSAKGKNVQASKDFVKWLWLDNTTDQEDWCLNYGFHIPPRQSLAAKATKLQSGPASEAVQIIKQYGKSTPPTWDGAMGTAYSNALTNIVKNNANAQSELKKAEDTCNIELQKIL